MLLATILLINNLGLFFLEVIGYHACHSVVMLLDGYYHLCQAILCTVRIVSRRIQFTYTSRHTYGLARVGVVGELVAFVSFLSLSVSVFLESIKHLIDVIFIIPKRESNSSMLYKAHGHEHVHSLIDHPNFILGIGVYATISNCLLGVAIIYIAKKRLMKINKQLIRRQSSLKRPLPKKILSKSLLITDTLPINHILLQVLNMLLGPLAILTCGILLVTLFEQHHVRVIYSRLVDPIICCFLFLSYFFMILIPLRDVMHLVLQAKPTGLKSNDIERTILSSISGVVKIHQLHIWRLTPQKTLATIHIVFNTTNDIMSKYQDILCVFQTFHIEHVTIQPEFSLSSEEINQLGEIYFRLINNDNNNNECNTLQLNENSTTEIGNEKTSSSSARKAHFHRRSSFNLDNGESESESENTSEEESDLKMHSIPVIPSTTTKDSSVRINLNNNK